MNKFKVGDRVLIAPTSSFYIGTPCNPINIIGTIQSISPGGCGISVLWDNKNRNGYNNYDLIYAESIEMFPIY